MDIAAAIYSALVGSSTITTKVATYGAGRAVFTSRPVPRDTARPFLVVESESEVTADALNAERIEATVSVLAIADNTGSETAILALAAAVKALLHREPLTISGGSHISTWHVSTTRAPTDETLVGRLLTFTLRAQ